VTRRPLLLLPALTLLLAVSGCGDDGADAKAAYVDQATAVCERAQSEFTSLPQPAAATDVAPFADETVSIAERAQRELAALTPPEDDRAELEQKVLDPFADLVGEAQAFADQVKAAGTDQAKLLPLLSSRPTTGDIDLEFLRSYGLETCAEAIDLS
jgi:Tfp pilus assembly protein PilP